MGIYATSEVLRKPRPAEGVYYKPRSPWTQLAPEQMADELCWIDAVPPPPVFLQSESCRIFRSSRHVERTHFSPKFNGFAGDATGEHDHVAAVAPIA